MDEFQSHYDAVITGTGLTQSVIGAAMARIGKSVFHCDQNHYYSQEWQSMNFKQIVNWCQTLQSDNSQSADQSANDPNLRLLEDSEVFRKCFRSNYISNVCQISYLCGEDTSDVTVTEATAHSAEDVPMADVSAGHETTAPEGNRRNNWTLFKFNIESRKFNLDLTPRLLYSRGSMVDLLVSSNISRYAEFKAVTRILTLIDDNLVDVPISRGDIFNNKDVSVVDKRMLMKFMSFCADYDNNYTEYQKYENQPIIEFLSSQHLSPVLQKYIINAIAMTSEDCPTKDALKMIHKFIHSAGRFGNTPFLFTLYGTGELPQAFCRLCAVFGGTYCLKKKFESIIVDKNNELKAVVIDGKRFNCDFVVTDYDISSEEQRNSTESDVKYISRAIVITDQSIKPSDCEHLSLLHIPKSDQNQSSVFLIEVGSSALVAPKGLFVQYLWCDSNTDNAKHDLMPIVKTLYNFTPELVSNKPKVLWSLYYNQKCTKPSAQDLPQNLLITSPPNSELDFDFAINEGRTIFGAMFPNEPFLPRAPDPNEIVFEGQPNNEIEMNEPNNQPIDGPVVNNDNNFN